MAFCTNCGNPVEPGVAFCTKCGAAMNQPASPPPGGYGQAPPPGYGAPRKSGSGLGKVLLIAGGVLLLIGVLVVGGLVYVGYKVKHKVQEVASDLGVSTERPAGPAAKRTSNVCSLLSPQEASAITGLRIDMAEVEQDACQYAGSRAETAGKGEAQASEAIEKMRKNEPATPQEAAKAMEQLMKGLSAQSAASGSGPLFTVRIKWGDAATAEAGYKIAMKAMTAGLPKADYGGAVEGVGDRAYLAPMGAALYMVKGDSWVEIEGPALLSRDALIGIARRVASRM